MSLPLLLVGLALAAAGCGGGGGGSVPADAVAVVGPTTITKTQFNELMQTAKGEDLAHKQKFPVVGSTAYTQLRDRAVSYLVQAAELQQEAAKIGITVSQKDVDASIRSIQTQFYKGSRTKFLAGLKKSGVTLAQFERLQRVTILAQKTNAKVTADVKVTNAEAKKYYDQNKAQQFTTPTSRSVRHILVPTKALAEQLEKKLANGASFAALAKKYSKDPTSAPQGGKIVAVEGRLVKPFQDVAFSLKTNQISPPVHTVYGWHIIQALGPVKKAKVTPFKKVAPEIQSNLLQQQKSTAWSNWLAKLNTDFKGKVSYQSGYAPATTATTTATTATTPPTTG